MKYNQKIIVLLIIVLLVSATHVIFGQPFNPPDGGPGDPPVGAPIDGGISALIIGGLALIGKKYFKNKKKKED